MSSVGGVEIAVLNRGLRPFLTKWHPRLQVWEAQRQEHVAPQEHEKRWTEAPDFRRELEELREELKKYASALAAAAGVDL